MGLISNISWRKYRGEVCKIDHNIETDFINYDKIKSVLLLYLSDLDEKNESIRRQIKSLVKDGKQVVAVGYTNKKDTLTPELDAWIMLSNKQISIWKKPLNLSSYAFLDKEFDLMMDLTTEQCLPLKYIAAYSKVKLKAGKKTNYNSDYELVINVQKPPVEEENSDEVEVVVYSEEETLFEQIVYYLKMLNANQ